MKSIWLLGLVVNGLLWSLPVLSAEASASRPRILIETDAGGDPDDEQSLVRFLLYANEWDVAGIIANRPQTREGENRNPERTGLGVVRRLVEAYGAVHQNLIQHDPRYPRPEDLLARMVPGYDDTEAAVNLILSAVDDPDPRPLWYSDWGTDHGASTNNLRRTLDRVLRERGPAGYAKFKSRLRLASADAFADHTMRIEPPFPLWVDTWRPELDRRRWYHRFSQIVGPAGGFDVVRDCLTGHGPLGALYPTNTTHWLKEGDSLSFIYLIPTGLSDPADPTLGGWGGRLGLNPNHPGKPYYWAGERDVWNGSTNRDNTLARWAVAIQNDFKARLDWCVQPWAKANHPPAVQSRGPSRLTVQSGDLVRLGVSASDPDGHALKLRWECYPEPGTFRGSVFLQDAETAEASFVAPSVTSRETLHLILTATDLGEPPLSRYARVIVTVEH